MIVGATAPVDASVLVGLVNGGEYVHVLLDALAAQRTERAFEIIVADRTGGATAAQIARRFPEVQIVSMPASATLPELRTQALDRARGRYVFVTEDHTVPPHNWIERLASELDGAPEHVIAVGGPVDNLMTGGSVDWAAFLCEYSGYLPPLETSEVRDVPGMNIAYRKSAFDGIERELLTRGFWESTLHPRLLAAGKQLRRVPDVVIGHRKHFGFTYFLSQRYHYSRYYAGVRFEPEDKTKRYAFAALSLALPPLILSRVVKNTLRKPKYVEPALRSLPALSCFALAWGVGEAVGYALGPGDSLLEVE